MVAKVNVGLAVAVVCHMEDAVVKTTLLVVMAIVVILAVMAIVVVIVFVATLLVRTV